jgi:hypothetical protein
MWSWSHQICHKCSSRGSEKVLILFWVIWNPGCLQWPLIGRNIFWLFSRNCMLLYYAKPLDIPEIFP